MEINAIKEFVSYMKHKNKTVVRSMDILNLFIEHPELTFQEIIDLSGIPKTSVYRMLLSLEDMGFLEKGPDAKYRLGLIFIRFGNLVLERLDIRQIAYPIMKQLHDEVEEAINLSVFQGEDETIYIEKIELKQKVRLYTAVGRKSPLYAGASSRIMLAHLPEEKIKEYLNRTTFKAHAKGTITNKERLIELIERSKELGYSVSHSELYDFTSEIAAPIFNNNGEVVASLSIAGMSANYQVENINYYAPKLLEATEEISRRLGYRVF